MSRLKLLFLITSVTFLSFCVADGEAKVGASRQYRQTRTGGYYNGEEDYYSRGGYSKPQVTKKAQGLGISAWGIIAIILSIIFIGFAIYYFIILYPILCKKERQYNTIELVAV